MKRIGEEYDIDLALVPTGGNFTMDSRAAARAVVELIKPRFVIPIHWFGNPAFNGTTGEDLVDAVAELKPKGRNKVKVVVLGVGDTAILSGAGRRAKVRVME